MGKKKIAFIHPDLGIGGAERLILDVAIALSKQKHEVLFITNHFDKSHCFEELKEDNYKVQVIGDWIPRSILGRCQAFCAYIRMVYLSVIYLLFLRKEDNPDIYITDLIPTAIPFLKFAGEKVIYYCHHPDLLASTPGGSLKKLYRKPIDWIEGKATAMADIILVNSAYTASIFKETFPEIKKPIQILYPTIAYSYQKTVQNIRNPTAIHDIIPEIKPNSFVFLSVNRFHPAKRLDLAINAMKKLRSNCSTNDWNRTFLIVAGGYDPNSGINAENYSKLLELTRELNLEEKIIFLKSPSDDFKAELLLGCDCLIYTPIKEHFGIVPLEAMTVGKPVIACNSGGPRETVEHGITGFLCETNAESMAQFMKEVMNSNVKELGENGKKRLEKLFSYDSFVKCLGKVIEQTNNLDKKNS